jgi:ABC-2 type transport system permease protein
LLSIPIATATAREQKVLRRFKATPMRPSAYLTADIVVNFVVALAGMTILILVAELAFNLRFGGNWLNVLASFTLSTLAFMAAGYVLASLSPTGRFAQVVGQVFFFPMMFLSGATLPLEIMPATVRQISEWLPLTHVIRLLQDLWFGQGWDLTAVSILVGLLIGGTALSATTFRWE